MELPNTFDCISQDLLIAKLHPYGLSFNTVTFLNLHLKGRKQNVRSLDVPQGSTYTVLFNIFLNDLFLCIKKSDLHNSTDDNVITVTCNTFTEFLKSFGTRF